MSEHDQGNQSVVNVISRHRFMLVLNAALESQSFRFARQIAQNWLVSFPGDLQVSFLLAKALLAEGNKSQAVEILARISQLEPEFAEVQEALAYDADRGSGQALEAAGCAYALGKSLYAITLPAWATLLRQAYSLFNEGKLDEAEALVHQSIGMDSNLLLAAVLHLKITIARGELLQTYQLANLYHTRWPDCLQFKLCLADAKMEMGDETNGVNLLHQCVAADAIGLAAIRLWGSDFRYRPLYPDNFEIPFDYAIPAAAAAILGWNKLPAGEIDIASSTQPMATNADLTPQETVPDAVPQTPQTQKGSVPSDSQAATWRTTANEELKSVEEAFARIAKKLNRPSIGRSDGRYPIYVILSTKSGLIKQYGQQTAAVVMTELDRLADLIAQQPRWGSLVFYPDDVQNLKDLHIEPVDSIDPWKIKLALTDLDAVLAKKGEMIGALLIVGGPEVVPFHQLPNPTDDTDLNVLSDNPYASLDSNYFITEWPVGRVPGEAGSDAGLLLEQLRKIIQYHTPTSTSQKAVSFLSSLINGGNIIQAILRLLFGSKPPFSLGYTAAVWKQSSQAVYKQLGDTDTLLISPPEYSGSFANNKITDSQYGYYNLHGLVDSPDWYGQKEAAVTDSMQDYPVALSPKDLIKNGKAPRVVFTESCFGANVVNKREMDALALKFISIGTLAFVGSTCVSYGSVSAPLIGADLLGYFFWKHLRSGCSAGEALMQAKVELVREMDQRQGFLDGEDQKTLLSFVLYGDPLVTDETGGMRAKTVMRMKSLPRVRTICDHQVSELSANRLSDQVIKEVKQIVSSYLPGLEDARVAISQQQLVEEDKQDSGKDSQGKQKKVAADGRVVVTISKQVRGSQHTHQHYARATLNAQGKVVKLAISR
ncbi:MAG: tetratricopeptide repeat protein [Anaerolineae bacterium]|nr:tetratricopeptide repeat protein [Anaerolineae bacterium]